MKFFGLPLFGFFLPFVGRRRIALNRDGSFVDTGEELMDDEKGFYYVAPWVFEWLGLGQPLTRSVVRRTDTHEIVTPDWDVAG